MATGPASSTTDPTIFALADTSLKSEDHFPIKGRKCFVTVGATAGFRLLLEAVLRPDFLSCLAHYGYDRLEIQCGPKADLEWVRQQLSWLKDDCGIEICCFQYTRDMKSHFLECRAERVDGVQYKLAGCVISHAGSGTILEVLRVDAPLIVVPNPTLMDNHQLELARECQKQGWAVMGDLGDLTPAMHAIWQLKEQGRLDELPPYKEPPFPVPEEERITLFDWMVLTCYPEELEKQLHRKDLREMDQRAAERDAREREDQRQEDEMRRAMD